MGNASSAVKFSPWHWYCVRGKSSVRLTDKERLEYFSPRIAAMMQARRDRNSSDIDLEIEASKSHWSEVTTGTGAVTNVDHEVGSSKPHSGEVTCGSTAASNVDRETESFRSHRRDVTTGSASESEVDEEEMVKQNRKFFQKLANDPQWTHPQYGKFFREYPFHDFGRKIAAGAQGEIYELIPPADSILLRDLVAKVFRKASLSQLQQQWPRGVLRFDGVLAGCLLGAMLLDDGRMGFVMLRCSGDLRKFIDGLVMARKDKYGPPFLVEKRGKINLDWVVMAFIAEEMGYLHAKGILHRDLKASNILVHHETGKGGECELYVADYECSMGVVGTGFWRAPEILLTLKNGDPIVFTEKADVYSYGMTCFEIAVGRLPFEGELEACSASYDLVIAGQRPQLPSTLRNVVKNVITRCWHPNPQERPSFKEIFALLLPHSKSSIEFGVPGQIASPLTRDAKSLREQMRRLAVKAFSQ